MSSLISTLLILSIPTGSPTHVDDEAVVAYRCDFESDADTNYDGWPDGWRRQRGRGYPLYLPIEIVNDTQPRPQGERCLKMQLDGGAAAAFGPPIEVTSQFSYLLQVHLRTEKLVHDQAYFELILYDKDHKVLEVHRSRKLRQVPHWTELSIGPVTPSDPATRWARVALHVQPTERADLVGAACWDDIWFGRLPRISISTNSEFNTFTNPSDIRIECRVSGFADPKPAIHFALLDHQGRVLEEAVRKFVPDRQRTDLRTAAARGPASPNAPRPNGFSGSTSWKPPVPGNGYYEIRASMEGAVKARTIKLVVMDSRRRLKTGEFGWSLPQGDRQLPLRTLADLLPEMGVHWVKFPVWYGESNRRRADQLAEFAERLAGDSIRLVGVLDTPPPEVRQLFADKGDLPVASVFVEPEIWHPAVNPVLTRLSLKVRWWQLGGDRDISFVNFPNLQNKIHAIRDDISRFGQEINLGIAWRTIYETPDAAAPPWSFLSYTANPPMTDQELQRHFARHPARHFQRWVVLDPLPDHIYDFDTRATDLVQRMIAAKRQRVSGIFAADPFDPRSGFLDEQAQPGKLLLAWRTTALMIAGTEYLGSIEMPEGSTNHIFTRGDEAVMVAWNSGDAEETLYLGDNIEQIDIWGRRSRPPHIKQDELTRQRVRVGRVPTFITGINTDVARWRMAFEFKTKRLASVFGREQTARYEFANTFAQGVGGTVVLSNKELLGDNQDVARITETQFKMAAREKHQKRFRVMLGADVNSGPQPIRADFSLTADKNYRFSVYRTIHVGLGDVDVDLRTHLDVQGNLVVEQRLINKSDQFVSFNCMLFAQGRRRQRRQVYNLGRGQITKVFVFPDGEELLGTELWFRGEEIGGARILNHHIRAQR